MVAISKAQDNFTLLHNMPISSPDQVIRTLIAEVADARSIPSLDKQVSLANRLFKIECGKTRDIVKCCV